MLRLQSLKKEADFIKEGEHSVNVTRYRSEGVRGISHIIARMTMIQTENHNRCDTKPIIIRLPILKTRKVRWYCPGTYR